MENNDQDKSRMEELYDKLASKFNEHYLAGKERGRESMTVALNKAHEQLSALGEFSAEEGEKLKQYLSRDLDQTISDAQHLGEEAKERFHPARLGAGALSSLVAVLEFTGNALRSLSDKAKETLSYKTGEMTSAGTLTCRECGQTVQLKKTGHVPPCPKCNGTLFNKGY
jgi:isocitrate dehydrogenase